jgi:hypothetical protein
MKGNGSMLGAAILAAVLGSNGAAASPAVCDMRLSIELTPDVPDPLDSGFLSSLLNNQVSYRLTLLVTELAGPGPDYRCRNVVEAMRRDGRVLSIHPDQDTAMRAVGGGVRRTTLDLRPPELRSLDVADSDAAQAVTITVAPLVLEEAPDSQPSFGGFASLYWAARHPTQAWRVLLPVQLDGYDLSPEGPERDVGDATPQALAEQRDVGADPAPIRLAAGGRVGLPRADQP